MQSQKEELTSSFTRRSVNATSRDFHGFTEQMSFARLVISASAQEPMPTFTANLLPQKHAITHLVEHYLENIHALYPFLSETNVFAAIDAVYQGYGSAMQHWTTRMVLAVALASLSQRRGDTFYQDAKRHAAGAFEFLESVVHPGSIPGIQAMLLLVLYSLFDPHHFESWYLIGLASRAMVDIGMHQEPPRYVELKNPSLELRKRVYTCIYSLDRSVSYPKSVFECLVETLFRSISMVHRRGFSFTDDSTSVTGPIQSAQSNSAFGASQLFLHNIEAGIQINELRRIQSHAYQRLFQSNRPNSEVAWPSMSSAIQDMHNWLEALPDTTKSPMKQLFRSDILFTGILILSPPGLERTLCDYGEFLIFEFATEYADLMASINQDRETFRFSTYHDVLRASFVAQRLVHTLSESISLYTGVLPKAPPNSIPPAGPIIIPARTVGEIVNKSHRCLDQLERYFEHQGPRYGYSEPLNDFKSQSRGVRQSIQERYDTWNRSLGLSRGQYLSQDPI